MNPSPPPPENRNSGTSEEIRPLRLAFVIIRRRWKLLTVTLAATLLGTAAYTLSIPKQYRPQATLEIRPETPLISSDSHDPAMSASRALWENYYRTQESILTGSSLHRATLEALPDPLRREFQES